MTPLPSPFSCFLMGSESLLIQCAEYLLYTGHEIRGIISAEPALRAWASQHHIATLFPDNEMEKAVAAEPFDYFFSITNLRVIPEAVLLLPRKGAINFHDGPLPAYAGLNTPVWALLAGEPRHGITWHRMTAGIDTGDILKQRTFDIAPDETALSLNLKCYEAAIESFAELVEELAAGAVRATPQDTSTRRYFSRVQRPHAAAVIDFREDAHDIARLVRALSFGSYANPLTLPKLLVDGQAVAVLTAEPTDEPSQALPGEIVRVAPDRVVIATSTDDLALTAFATLGGAPLTAAEAAGRIGLHEGQRLVSLGSERAARLTELTELAGKHEPFWTRRLAALTTLDLPYADRSRSGDAAASASMPVELPEDLATALSADLLAADALTGAFAAFLARLCGQGDLHLGYADPALRAQIAGAEALFASRVPLRAAIDPSAPLSAALETVARDLTAVRGRFTYAHDAIARLPQLTPALKGRSEGERLPVAVEVLDTPSGCCPAPGSELTLAVAANGQSAALCYNASIFDAAAAQRFADQFAIFLQAAVSSPDAPISTLPLLSEAERRRLLYKWNDTAVDYPRDRCVHHLIEAQAARTPDAVAVICEDVPLTYRALNERANRLARHLVTLGVGPDTLAGICLERSLDLVVAVLAVHKAGGAYVPLDPAYPADRIAYMLEDSAAPVVLTQERLLDHLPASAATTVCFDRDWPLIEEQPGHDLATPVASSNLAYVIYTSGSTGRPKGVMIEHRNVVNFFTSMDDRVAHDPPGVWLAVTSLSFDISVLELLWTLARGFTVVMYTNAERGTRNAEHKTSRGDSASPSSALRVPRSALGFSLFYFSSEQGDGTGDVYRLLMEGARFADEHGFEAVWTPERHFHAFGGLFPNPAVTSAAVAAITSRVKIRAGSVVLPLHSPLRVAEEWAVVDNLSKGRVGISVASGWQPNDFVLKPENYADAKRVMVRDVEVVRRLWWGEAVEFPGPDGRPVPTRVLPRPVQAELPVWVTAAGNPETFRIAGELGAGILTHLLGQTIEEVADKIEVYRAAWRAAGHPGHGHVTLMLHTFVGEDTDAVREIVRGPMKDYLRSSMGLIEKYAYAFPIFQNRSGSAAGADVFTTLTDEERDALLEHAFERYFETSGLFGTPETCIAIAERLRGIGVNEIACLIDFGVETEQALAGLHLLNQVREACATPMGVAGAEPPPRSALPTEGLRSGGGPPWGPSGARGDPAEVDWGTLGSPIPTEDGETIPALIRRHRVTHLQCTPSMATMLAADPGARTALATLKQMMVGGEAFPAALAADLAALVHGQVTNMYGPTETTIWSSTYPVTGASAGAAVPIGTPIANTQLYILDPAGLPAPVGIAGELLIGGDGVVRGYLNRPELTAERFVPNPFVTEPGARMYRTGDFARWLPDGTVEFLGRMDNQVKLRGYRIELGEIENRLLQQPGVREAVVIAREDTPGDTRLVAYAVAEAGAAPVAVELRTRLAEVLPEYMVPSHIVFMDALPLTPNKKVDRKALPAPSETAPAVVAEQTPPAGRLEETLAGIWRELLGLPSVGTTDNFFDLGGHSLLVVQVHRRIAEDLGLRVSMTDLFRFPTIRSLAGFLGDESDADDTLREQSASRADARRELMNRRRARLVGAR